MWCLLASWWAAWSGGRWQTHEGGVRLFSAVLARHLPALPCLSWLVLPVLLCLQVNCSMLLRSSGFCSVRIFPHHSGGTAVCLLPLVPLLHPLQVGKSTAAVLTSSHRSTSSCLQGPGGAGRGRHLGALRPAGRAPALLAPRPLPHGHRALLDRGEHVRGGQRLGDLEQWCCVTLCCDCIC